jgi:molecular chaperone GrpE (heat shock protein)
VSAGLDRDDILRRFAEWLDAALPSEEAPSGIDAEILSGFTADGSADHDGAARPADSYALWSAMTALTQEVKLQGRAFRELSETAAAQPGRIAEELRTAFREREREAERGAERRCRKETLGILIDVRDRLDRGLAAVRTGAEAIAKAVRKSWLARVVGQSGRSDTADVLAALAKGYRLTLDHVDQALRDFNAHEIRCHGEAFDPRRMTAVDTQVSDSVPEGTVIEVYRSGYEWNGEVFRPAQVKVSCAPPSGDDNERFDSRD